MHPYRGRSPTVSSCQAGAHRGRREVRSRPVRNAARGGEHDVGAHHTSTFDPDAAGVYGDSSLTVYPGDHITKFTVTRTITLGDENGDGESSPITCPLAIKRGD
jgi:hypothetical protein